MAWNADEYLIWFVTQTQEIQQTSQNNHNQASKSEEEANEAIHISSPFDLPKSRNSFRSPLDSELEKFECV